MAMNTGSRYLIQWTDSQGGVSEQELHQGLLTIGRSPDCDLIFSDPMVSRQHARIHVEGNMVAIHDLGSRNGTIVNGERVASTELKAGDEISVGEWTIRLIASPLDGTRLMQPASGATVFLPHEPPRSQPLRAEPIAADDRKEHSSQKPLLQRLASSPVLKKVTQITQRRASGLVRSIKGLGRLRSR